MKTLLSFCAIVWLATGLAQAQFVLDCTCLAMQPGLTVTNCQAAIPDVCAVVTNCFRGTIQPPPPPPLMFQCSQTPAAGTPVGPGTYPIMVTVQVAGAIFACPVSFQVVAPNAGQFTLQCAPAKTVNCDAPWNFDPPAPMNPCCPNAALPNGGVSISVVSDVTNGVCPQVITRTWNAVDNCGQSATCSQAVTVVDNVPPTINCGQNEVLQCGLGWGFTVPIVSDNCTAPSDLVLSIVSTTTNLTCVPTFVATRVWKVTDLCGNSTLCTQVVTIVDMTPPTMTCAPNKTVECGSNWTFDMPTASDYCMNFLGNGNVTIAVVSTTTNGTCPEVITRTWSATDGCGNSSQCSQTVTVVDTTPPILDCNCLGNNPAVPLTVVGCSNAIPDLCALAIGPAPSCGRDNCGPLTCAQNPVAGTIVGPGIHPVMVTITDCAGQTASCTVNFTVVPPPGGCTSCPDQTNSWNTGMSGGNPLPTGAADPNYVLVSVPPGGCTGPAQVMNPSTLPVGPWVANGPNSQWIGAGPTASCQEGVYQYRLCFYLPCTEGASIIGQWAVDDNAVMLLNGQPTGNTIPSPQFPNLPLYDWFPVSITNGFVCGTNCLDFYVTNAFIGINPTGFRAELTNVFNDCCCPPPQPVSTVFSGMDPAGGPLPLGAPDPQFALTCAPPGVALTTPVTVQPHPLWVPNGPSSQWIGVDPSNFGPPGVYCYELNFNIPCPPGTPINASLTGQWTADDWAEMYLNGQPTGHTVPSVQFPNVSFAGWHPINITSGFVPGLNTLTFYVTNAGGPTGLRLELTNSASCCHCTNVHCDVTIICPPDTNIVSCSVVGGQTPVTYNPATASSTCGSIASLLCAPPSGGLFPLGTTPVTCTATDTQGHSKSCSFNVTVTSPQSPWQVICPPLNLSVTGCPPVMPDLSNLVTIVTNCPLPCPITISQNIAPGTVLTPGTHVVIIRTCDCTGRCFDCDVIVTAVPSPGCCTTTPVLTLNSGVGPSGPLTGGSLDPQFLTGAPMFTTPNPYVANWIHPLWLPNTAASQWVGPFLGYAGGPVGNYYYTNRFFLCSTNQASITGRWAGDDSGNIQLNGGPPGNFLPAGFAFASWTPVSITSGFVPGWNELVFCITNSLHGSVTGLRTELRATACCNSCVTISCPPDLTVTNCPPGANVSYSAPSASSGCDNVTSLSCTPASGSNFPIGTNTVICTAVDSAGNAATCSFTITVRPAAPPVVITCPPNQTILTCSNSAVAYFKVKVMGQIGPVVCTPPSGTTFPLGTNVVTCTATNICGQSASCSFLVIVKKHPLGPPALTITAGLPDNFAGPADPAAPSACAISVMPPAPPLAYVNFDTPKATSGSQIAVSHRFTGLPNNVVQAELVLRVKPDPRADGNLLLDRVMVGVPPACNAFVWQSLFWGLPGGGNWLVNTGSVPATFVINLGAMDPNLITRINADQFLDVTVGIQTIVDYMQLRLWICPPPHTGIAVPYDLVGGATTALRPTLSGPAVPVGPVLPAICVFPNPNLPSGISLQPGRAKSISFTTVLDFEAAEGSGLDLVLPPDSRQTNGMPYLSFRSKGAKGYCVKTCKLYDDEPDISYRSTAVGTNGDLFPSFTWDGANIGTNVLLYLNHLDGVTSVVMTVSLDLETREVSLEFPHCIWTPDNARKGWDGCIYGNGTPSKGTKTNKTARLILTPNPSHTPLPPVTELSLLATGLPEFLVEDPELETMGRKWGDGHVTLMKAYDDGETERLSFVPLASGGGVHTDLGHAESFSIGIHHFENGDIPTEEQLFRIIGGPIRGLTNRPPPPTIPLRLANIPEGVACTVDFSDFAAEAVTVQLYNHGVLIGQGMADGAALTEDNALLLDHWPDRIGQLSVDGTLRLTSGEPFTVSGLNGDEIRIIPKLPAALEVPSYIAGLECLASEDSDNLLYDLQRTLACPPATMTITRRSDGISIMWPGDGYRLQGAEKVDGPWYELGVSSPVALSPGHPARFFRLVCD